MGIEHFKEGLGPEHLHLLGVSAPSGGNEQAKRLYAAEYGGEARNGWTYTDPNASKTISLNGARDLVGEAIFHPAMDSIPGIEGIRASYDPKKDVVFKKKLWVRDEEGKKDFQVGGWVTDPRDPGRGGVIQINSKMLRDDPLRVGGITHEASHKLLMNDKQFDNEGHSWPMARLHVHMVRQLLGKASANALKAHYEKNGVDFGGKGV